jgi:hypothetical protein
MRAPRAPKVLDTADTLLEMAISREAAGHSIFRGDTLRAAGVGFRVLTIEGISDRSQMTVTAFASSNFASA